LSKVLSGKKLAIEPFQIPYEKGSCWMGTTLPTHHLYPPHAPYEVLHNTLSIVSHGAAAYQTMARQSGFLLDDWTEQIPTDSEITGITFHYNQPNAAPPQTLLLAVSPTQTGSWTWESLIGTLNDTFNRAQRRAVDPDLLHTAGLPGTNILLSALISEFSTSPDIFSVDYARATRFSAVEAAYLSVKTKNAIGK
jgi:hypothetical protein